MKKIIMLGATGAVGTQVVRHLLIAEQPIGLTLLGRRPLTGVEEQCVSQHQVDVLEPEAYEGLIAGHDAAICTLGVGEPSKVSRDQFVRIDKTAVLDFATHCKANGVQHFQLLSSVGTSSDSRSFFLRTKGELEDALVALEFERLSIFQPSMILTPTNRYGVSQAITLAVWPALSHLLIGPLQRFRGIKVDLLGKAIANNVFLPAAGLERFSWKDFMRLSASP